VGERPPGRRAPHRLDHLRWRHDHAGAIVDSYASDATSVEEVVEILQGFVAGLVSLSGGLLMELSRMSDQPPAALLTVIGRRMAEATGAGEDEEEE
jgi:hypothetical protein